MDECSVDGCLKPTHCRGWCGMHYNRWRRGVPFDKPEQRRGLSETERVWQYVNVVDFGECWEWLAYRNEQGYGQGMDEKNYPVVAHRFTYETFWLRKLSGLACHTCNNPPCCNPMHIYDGTTATNAQDAVRAGTSNFLRPDLPRARGSAHGNAKLDEDRVREIRKLYAQGGVSQQALADRFGVDQSKISGIVRNKTWTHVTG